MPFNFSLFTDKFLPKLGSRKNISDVFFTTGAATTETETKPMKLFLKLKKKKIRKSFFCLRQLTWDEINYVSNNKEQNL